MPIDWAPVCSALSVCRGARSGRPASNRYEKINDDRATYKEGVRATYKCAEGPPGSKWNLAADAPPLKRVGRSAVRDRRAYKRARAELEMLKREAQPKQKP